MTLRTDRLDLRSTDARGRGYATEAGRALLATADEDLGELIAMIDPRNAPSQNVATKLGFVFWKEAVVDGYLDGIWRLSVARPSDS